MLYTKYTMKQTILLAMLVVTYFGTHAQDVSDRQKWNDLLLIESTQRFPYVGKLDLGQNYPNPLSKSESTVIRYQATDVSNASIVVYNDVNKEQVLVLNNLKENIGQVKINGDQLPEGTYIYALLVNGRMVEKKKMIVVD